jgi:hypothetical protein
LSNVLHDIEEYYDIMHPPQFSKNPLLSHHHSKRCTSIENSESINAYFEDKWKKPSKNYQILISTPCLGSDSLGNGLAAYFENIVCANLVGMHYAAAAKIWEPSMKDQPSPFLSMIPSFIEHPNPRNEFNVKSTIKNICKCPGSCHERSKAVWHTRLDLIKPILLDAINYHMKTIDVNKTIIKASDLSNSPINTTLPLYPDAAIHYRCGDNFVGHYGFLPFNVFKKIIPKNVKTIYVLAENRNRKTKLKNHLALKCDLIFRYLYEYLLKTFPKSTI